MKRIAVISPGLGIYPRGIENAVLNIFPPLSHSYKIIFFTGKKINIKNILVIRILSFSYIPFLYKLYFKIIKKIHLPFGQKHDFRFFTFSIFLLFSLLTKPNIKIIFNYGGYFCMLACKIHRFLFKSKIIISGQTGINSLEYILANTHPDIYSPLTKEAEKWIKGKIKNIKTYIIPNPVDTKLFTPEKKHKQLNLKKPIIIYIGVLEPVKNLFPLIKAIKKSKDLSLLIIGNGSLYNKITQYLEPLKKQNRFLLIKFIEHNQLPEYINFCDIGILPSKSEGLGNVAIEILSCGLPVIVNDYPVLKEIVDYDNDLICDCSDGNKILDKIYFLLKNKKQKEYYRNKVLKYDTENIIKLTEELINKI